MPSSEGQAGKAFIEVEVDTCELYISLALNTDETATRSRRIENAQKAYEAAFRFLSLAEFDGEERRDLETRLVAAGKVLRQLAWGT